VAVAAVGALFVGACGSGGSYSSSSSTPSTLFGSGPTSTGGYPSSPAPTRPGSATDYGQVYLNIISSTNHATTAFDIALAPLGTDPTPAQLRTIADPLASALENAQQNLVATTWPPSAAGDIKTLTAAVAAMIKQLRSVDTAHNFDASTWIGTVRSDETNIVDAARVVRKDLGVQQ
jgi:hypothetical protein